MGHFIKPMRQNLEAKPIYEKIDSNDDSMDLINLIKSLMYNYQSHKYLMQVPHKSLRKLYTLHQ